MMFVFRATVALALACLGAAQSGSNFTNSTASSSVPVTTSLSRNATLLASSNSVALNTTTSAAKNGTGAWCNSERLAWSLASSSYSSANPIPTVGTNTRNYTSTLWASTKYNCTRMCDTICYAGPTTVSSSTTAIYEEYPVTWTSWSEYPTPKPNCSIGFSDCLELKTSYSTAWTSYWSMPAASRSLTTMPKNPDCSACVSTGCTFAHAGMSLYFWPVTTSVTRDYCAWDPVGGIATTNLPNPNTTYTETTTGPYAVVDGITMYQGNVYLSLMEPMVTDNCGNIITRKTPGHNVLTIASTDLYSVRKYPHNLLPWSVNYDDFNEPTPWSAYFGDRYCANNRPLCSVIFPGAYHPVMVMPPEMRYLDKNWETCSYDKYGIFDPPIALKSVGNPFATTSPTANPTTVDPQPVTTAPQPGQPPSDGNPAPTTTAKPNDPPSNNDPQDPPSNNDPNPNPSDPQDPPSNSNPNPSNPTNKNPNPAPGQNPAPNPNPNPTSPANNSPGNPSPPVITLGPSIVPINPTGGIVINPGTTLSSGGAPLVISSTTFSIGNGGLTIISPTTSTQIPFSNSPVTVPMGPGGAPLTIDPAGTIVLGGTTLQPGGPAVTVDGSTLSIGPSGIVVVGPSGTTSTIPLPAGDPSSPQILTIGSSTFTVLAGDVTLAPGTTLHFGDPAVTISGITYSIGPSGLVVGSPAGTSTIPIDMATQVLTLGDHTFTVYDGELVLGPGTTIGVGDPAVTVDGTTYSVGPSGVVVLSSGGGTTVPVTGTGTSGGGGSGGPSATGAVEGAAGRVRWRWRWGIGVVGGVLGLVMV
ncbi:hypothetical protein K458DRAFT_482892 [Lentithecium fluviatile CBS 122367]|uniref:Uncharacterized protein n=1 Tax=Lentithecium fluviatile CBS 122367 TaxID=1168545 RepID=A0A6G1JJT1_9PLEO|nr:hypothetical protein K458DRAFT_482892 [Lentithecium fluviatile CBS 122367]